MPTQLTPLNPLILDLSLLIFGSFILEFIPWMISCTSSAVIAGFHQSYQGLSPSPLPSGLPNGAGGDPRLAELLHNYDLRLQHQQLMLNLNNAYNDLFKQQEALENFYSEAENTEDKRENLNSNNSVHERLEEDEEENPYNQRDVYSPYGRPGQGAGSYQRKYGLPEDTQG